MYYYAREVELAALLLKIGVCLSLRGMPSLENSLLTVYRVKSFLSSCA